MRVMAGGDGVRHVTDDERRARIARRHGIVPAARYAGPVAATEAMTVLHATEPATVYLSLLARVDGLTIADVDRELYDRRTLVKQLAMRRTVFVLPRDLLAAAWGSASARVAGQLRPRLAKEIEQGGLADDGAAWVDEACAAVLARLEDGSELSAAALREQLPELAGRIDLAVGKAYGANVSIAPRVLTQLGVEGLLARGRNGGHWRISRPQWTTMRAWLGEVEPAWKADEGWAELVRRWLWTFGPGTAADIQWWLGATVGIVKQALADIGAEPVTLDGAETGWLLPDDLDEVTHGDHWAALLPVLDPTVMGWKARDFYLGPHAPLLFDSNGNAGTTAWWDGRIVGCWVQDESGAVEVRHVEKVPAAARRALAVEADRLTAWLDGVKVSTVYPSAAMKS
jgi:DNA glycosylase AlkZ-like